MVSLVAIFSSIGWCWLLACLFALLPFAAAILGLLTRSGELIIEATDEDDEDEAVDAMEADCLPLPAEADGFEDGISSRCISSARSFSFPLIRERL